MVVELWAYLLVLLPSCIPWICLWNALIFGQLYYCSDASGLDVLSPPFVHPPNSPTSPYPDLERSQQLLGGSADFYLNGMNETKLNLVWGCFFLGMVATPEIVFYLVQRLGAWLVKRAQLR
ncbi:MAG: hypothetical protein ACAF41_01570 [Leptolyngbya sp. BL-A-14]